MTSTPATRKRQINNIDLDYTIAEHGSYFMVAVHREKPGRVVRFYYHATKASLLRVNRVQRLLIRRVVDGYVTRAAVTVEPDSNAELRQAVS